MRNTLNFYFWAWAKRARKNSRNTGKVKGKVGFWLNFFQQKIRTFNIQRTLREQEGIWAYCANTGAVKLYICFLKSPVAQTTTTEAILVLLSAGDGSRPNNFCNKKTFFAVRNNLEMFLESFLPLEWVTNWKSVWLDS